MWACAALLCLLLLEFTQSQAVPPTWIQAPAFVTPGPFTITVTFLQNSVNVTNLISPFIASLPPNITAEVGPQQWYPGVGGFAGPSDLQSIIVLRLTPTVYPVTVYRIQVPENFLGPGQPTVEPSYIKLIFMVPSLPAAPTVVEMSGPPLHNGVDPWGYPVPMSILVYFDTPIPINDLFLDDLVIINARWFQYEASETHKPLRHLSASSGTLQAYWLPVIPTANANIVISLGENVVLPPGNTVANFTSVFVPPGAVTSPAFSSIQGPSTHDGEPFEVVVQFTKDVPEFTEDFVEVLSGGYVYGPENGTFHQISNLTHTRFSMFVRGFISHPVTVNVVTVRVPLTAPEPQALNTSLSVPYSPPNVGVATVTAPRFHYGTGCPFFVQVSFAAAIDSFAEDDVYFTFGRSSVLNVTTASPTSYIVEINPGVNSTIGVQIIDKDHWPVPEWSPSNVSSVYYVAPGTEFSTVSSLIGGPIVYRYANITLVFTFSFSGPVQGFEPHAVVFTPASAVQVSRYWSDVTASQYTLAVKTLSTVSFSVFIPQGVVATPVNNASDAFVVEYIAPTPSPTPFPSSTPTSSPTLSETALPSLSSTQSCSLSPTASSSLSSTSSVSSSGTPSVTLSVSESASSSLSPSVSATGSISMSNTQSLSVSSSVSVTASVSPSISVSATSSSSHANITPSVSWSTLASSSVTPSLSFTSSSSVSMTPTPPPTQLPSDLCAFVNCGDHGTCNSASGGCVCASGFVGITCSIAVPSSLQSAHCFNSVQDGGESDVDCGGSTKCETCWIGMQCTQESDCGPGAVCVSSGLCTSTRTVGTGYYVQATLRLPGIHKRSFLSTSAQIGFVSAIQASVSHVVLSQDGFISKYRRLAVTAEDVIVTKIMLSPSASNSTDLTLWIVSFTTINSAQAVASAFGSAVTSSALKILLYSSIPGFGAVEVGLVGTVSVGSMSGSGLTPIRPPKTQPSIANITPIIAGVVAGVVVLVAAIAGLFQYRRKKRLMLSSKPAVTSSTVVLNPMAGLEFTNVTKQSSNNFRHVQATVDDDSTVVDAPVWQQSSNMPPQERVRRSLFSPVQSRPRQNQGDSAVVHVA